jgi:hyperosmotically inducible protein
MAMMKVVRFVAVVTLAGVFSAGLSSVARAQTADPTDARTQADVAKALNNKRFADVKESVQNGVVTLTGTVDLYSAKEDADKKAQHRKNVKGVQNLITIAGPTVEDATLREKLAQKLTYDRVGYGTTTFNAITLGVQNGVATLGGVAYNTIDKASALDLVGNYPGVKDVVDQIQVAPPSPMDDRIRVAEARAIYGYPSLNKYAIDPAKPIRITVINGNVTLSGVVDTQSDKEVAGLRANGVPGTFKVTNNIQVVGQTEASAK